MKTLLILSQVYVPDPASVGQHMHDVAVEMVRRGFRVVVLTSEREYEEPTRRYPRAEQIDGVEVRRLPWSSFGKASLSTRLAGAAAFLSQATLAALAMPRVDHVLVSTSPPMCSMAAVALKRLRGADVTFWVMDINPDQIVATGAMRADALPVRAFDWMNRRILADARNVVALDRYMVERLNSKLDVGARMSIVAPWPLVDVDAAMPTADRVGNAFRREHGFGDAFVVMYSGNLSPTHPVDTVLEAARRLRSDPGLLFVFVGGGLGKAQIERYVAQHALSNVRVLPYQPLATLQTSLSAADVHLVAMGDATVGIVHPCKVYGAMAVARPILVLAPERCHLSDLVREHAIGWQVAHGDVDGAVAAIAHMRATPPAERAAMGARAYALVQRQFSRRELCGRLCDLLQSA